MTPSASRTEGRPRAAAAPALPAPAAIPAPREQVIPAAENLAKSLLAIALLLGSFYASSRVAAAIDAAPGLPPAAAFALRWGAVGLFAVASGIVVTMMIALAHEAVHRVLFRSSAWNEAWGGLLSALSLVPFHANRQFHLTHHGYAHQPGRDPEHAMHDRSFVQAAAIGGFIGVQQQYRIFFSNLRHLASPKYTARALKDLFFVAAAGAFYFALVPALGIPLSLSVVPMLLVFPMVFAFRALSDHYGLPAAEPHGKREDILDADADTWAASDERRQREASGWVVLTAPWLEWLWSHANYHEVHHKYPYLSHRYLPGVFEATRARQPYYVARGYWRSFARLSKLAYYSPPEAVRPFLARREGAE